MARLEGAYDRVSQRSAPRDPRQDSVEREIDRRFEALDKKFERRCDALDEKIDAVRQSLDAKIDRRFDALQKEFDRRFEALETKIEAVNARSIERYDGLLGLIVYIAWATYMAAMIVLYFHFRH